MVQERPLSKGGAHSSLPMRASEAIGVDSDTLIFTQLIQEICMEQVDSIKTNDFLMASNIQHELGHDNLSKLIADRFPHHPFHSLRLNKYQLEAIMAEYLAMSSSFPYLQAGSCSKQIIDSITKDRPIRPEVELTSVVGAFLVWDEFGGWLKTAKTGAKGLPGILDTSSFHSNILKSDLSSIFGKEIVPRFGLSTKRYLLDLYRGLSDIDDLSRCAMMTSFEFHAERMIKELWSSLKDSTGCCDEELRYFVGHVGGNDPAEAYHVKMTQKLITTLVGSNVRAFKRAFLECYSFHFDWCHSIVNQVDSREV